MKRTIVIALGVGLALGLAGTIQAQSVDARELPVKKAIADSMTPEQLAAYRERLAQAIREGRLQTPAAKSVIRAPGDTCAASTPEVSALPFGPAADTTVAAIDDFNLPADTTNPTCTASSTCTGAGPAGSLPRGAIYTGTGTGPDRAFQIIVSASCTLDIDMDPTSTQDLALIVYQSTCSSLLSDCVCVDDTGVGGATESVALDAVAGTTYFLVTDGYSTGGTPPGPSGPYTMSVAEITATGCTLVPVELLDFDVL
jgi:hypothetical protein